MVLGFLGFRVSTPSGVAAHSSGCEPRDYSKHPEKQEKPRQGWQHIARGGNEGFLKLDSGYSPLVFVLTQPSSEFRND